MKLLGLLTVYPPWLGRRRMYQDSKAMQRSCSSRGREGHHRWHCFGLGLRWPLQPHEKVYGLGYDAQRWREGEAWGGMEEAHIWCRIFWLQDQMHLSRPISYRGIPLLEDLLFRLVLVPTFIGFNKSYAGYGHGGWCVSFPSYCLM